MVAFDTQKELIDHQRLELYVCESFEPENVLATKISRWKNLFVNYSLTFYNSNWTHSILNFSDVIIDFSSKMNHVNTFPARQVLASDSVIGDAPRCRYPFVVNPIRTLIQPPTQSSIRYWQYIWPIVRNFLLSSIINSPYIIGQQAINTVVIKAHLFVGHGLFREIKSTFQLINNRRIWIFVLIAVRRPLAILQRHYLTFALIWDSNLINFSTDDFWWPKT